MESSRFFLNHFTLWIPVKKTNSFCWSLLTGWNNFSKIITFHQNTSSDSTKQGKKEVSTKTWSCQITTSIDINMGTLTNLAGFSRKTFSTVVLEDLPNDGFQCPFCINTPIQIRLKWVLISSVVESLVLGVEGKPLNMEESRFSRNRARNLCSRRTMKSSFKSLISTLDAKDQFMTKA